MTFSVPLLGYTARVVGTIAATFFIGASFVGITIPSQTFLQLATPKEFQGRVFGNFWFIVTVITILPVIFSGAVAELLGTQTLMALLTVFCGASFIVIRRFKGGNYGV